MSFAVECYLDKSSTEKVNAFMNLFRENNITVDEGTSPHISLAIYEKTDRDLFQAKLKEFSARSSSLSFTFMNFGIFPTEESVLFLAPKVSGRLLSFHREFHMLFEEFRKDLSEYYSPEYWVPHCTVGIYLNNEQIKKAAELLYKFEFPLKAEIIEIGVNEFPPNRELYRYKLKG